MSRVSRYRVYFNNQPASQEQLDQLETITVEQAVDMAWEARIQIPLCTDEAGRWQGQDDRIMAAFSRVRLEIQVGEGAFSPLIDGPIVGFDTQMSSEPGQSSLTLLVHDDSVYLNRTERIVRFDNQLDHEIATQIFEDIEQIASTDIETTPTPTSSLPPVVMQRGTDMQLLRMLAYRQGLHAYVLPGANPGESVGCLKALPTEPSDLPPLVLLGSDRNVNRFDVQHNAQSPGQVTGFALSITDRAVSERTTSVRDLELLGEEVPEPEASLASRLLPPGFGDSVDLERLAAARTEEDSYAFEATGSVLADCYGGVLRPYQVVTVRGVNSQLSGNYLIYQVTHTLGRSSYSQDFTVRRNARSTEATTANNSLGVPQGAASAGIIGGVSFNLQGSIF